EEPIEDAVLGGTVPGAGETAVGLLDGTQPLLGLGPGSQAGHVDVVAVAGHVAPAGDAPLEHHEGETVGPEDIEGHVPHDLELRTVLAQFVPGEDLRDRGCLGVEVAADDGVEVVYAAQRGEVEFGNEIGGEVYSAVPIELEWLHVRGD